MGEGWTPPPIEPEHGVFLRYLALPWRRFEIDTHLTPGECVHALEAIVEPRKWFRLSRTRPTRDFEGEVNGLEFSIRRIIRYRNSFLPVISGTILPGFSATRVRIAMRPNWFALAFWVAWMMAVAGFAALLLFHGTEKIPPQAAAVVLIMAVVGYLICVIPFGIEAQKARRILADVLSGSRPPASH